MSEDKYLNRKVKEKHTFKEEGTFQSKYAAERWRSENGYSYGSSCKDIRYGGNMPIAMIKGEYDLPQKWKNFDAADKKSVDGVIVSDDFREGEVTIYIFN